MRLMYTRIKATANLQTRFLIRLLGKDSHSQDLIIKQTPWRVRIRTQDEGTG